MAKNFTKTITLGLDYSGFSGSIAECNNKLKVLDASFQKANAELGNNASAAQKAALQNDYLTNKIELQKARVDEARKKYEALMNAHADTSKIDRANAALKNEEASLARMQNELKGASSNTQTYASAVMALITTLAAVSGAFVEAAEAAAEYIDEVNTMSEQSGASTEMVQTWMYMADVVDVSANSMAGAMSRMKKNMDSAKDGSGEMADAFKELGFNVTNGNGSLRDASDVMYEVFDALRDMENETEKDALAMKIFGKGADELAGAIDGGSEAFNNFNASATEAGAIIGGSAAQSLQELNDAMDEAKAKTSAAQNQLGAMAAEAILPLVEASNALDPTLRTVLVGIGTVASKAAPAVAGLAMLSIGFQTAGLSASVAAAEAAAFVAEIGVFVALAAAVVAAGVAIGYAIASIADSIEGAGGLGPWIQGIVQTCVEALNALTAAIKNFFAAFSNTPDNFGDLTYGTNATGSSAWRGGLTMVGEDGPELVSLPQGSRIYNSYETNQRMGNTYNISMNCDLSKMKSVGAVVSAVEGLAGSVGCGGY